MLKITGSLGLARVLAMLWKTPVLVLVENSPEWTVFPNGIIKLYWKDDDGD